MRLLEITEVQKKDYNKFIATQQGGSFLQSWEWGDWQKSLGRKVLRYVAVNDQGVFIAAAQLIVTPLAFGWSYLYCPYGPVLNEGFNVLDLILEFRQLRKKILKVLFVRLEPRIEKFPLNIQLQKTVNIQPGKTLIVNLKKTGAELLAAMHSKTRYNIRLAQKHNVVVEREFQITVGHGLYFDEAISLILETARRQQYFTHQKDYYEKLVSFFSLHNNSGDMGLGVYKAIYEKKVLASAIVVDFGKTRTYLFGGSSLEYRNVMAPYALHFQAIMDAKEKELEYYDFGGLESSVGKVAQFARFKEGFGGEVVVFSGAYDVVVSSVWYNIYRIIRIVNRAVKKIKVGFK